MTPIPDMLKNQLAYEELKSSSRMPPTSWCTIVILSSSEHFFLLGCCFGVRTFINFPTEDKYAAEHYFSFLNIFRWSKWSESTLKTETASHQSPVIFVSRSRKSTLRFLFKSYINYYCFGLHSLPVISFPITYPDIPAVFELDFLLQRLFPIFCQVVYTHFLARNHLPKLEINIHAKNIFGHTLLRTFPSFVGYLYSRKQSRRAFSFSVF